MLNLRVPRLHDTSVSAMTQRGTRGIVQGAPGPANDLSANASNLAWNLAGAIVPALAALLAMPLTIRLLGNERFGLLTLCGLILAYFALFDFGLTRALTRFASERIGSDRLDEVPSLFAESKAMMLRLSIVGAILATVISPFIVADWLQVPETLRTEALASFWISAASLPVLIATGWWRAMLEANGRFDLVNRLHIPIATLTAVAPALVLPICNSLVAVTTLLLGIRICAWAVFRQLTVAEIPSLVGPASGRHPSRRALFQFGGWVTVSNLLGPLMVYLDRFLIGGAVSLAAIAYYTIAYELVTRAWLLVGAVIGVILPSMSATLAKSVDDSRTIYSSAIISVFSLTLAPLALISLFASEVLELWLNREFAANAATVLRVLAAGVLVNCAAQVSLTVIHAAGRADWVAKVHLAEIGPYLLALWWCVNTWGINGVAIAWAARVMIDALLMAMLANKVLKLPTHRNVIAIFGLMLLGAGIGAIGLLESIAIRAVTLLGLCFACAAVALSVIRLVRHCDRDSRFEVQ